MAVQVLEIDKWHEVSAFQWLTGWPQENLLDALHGPALTVSSRYTSLTTCSSDDRAQMESPACLSIHRTPTMHRVYPVMYDPLPPTCQILRCQHSTQMHSDAAGMHIIMIIVRNTQLKL